jgi:glycosyltransferase involved in cell wall biosynthesis
VIGLHAIILTFNEELHIERCICSILGHCDSITLIDSGSEDRTAEIAKNLGASVLVNRFVTHAAQVNFAIDHFAGRGGWLLRIDADEVVNSDSWSALSEAIERADETVDGVLIRRRIHFLGRRMRHGTIEPSWQLRLWRNGRGRCEQRLMDEHIKVEGRVVRSEIIITDENLNSLTWWTAKHNAYADREAVEVLNVRYRFMKSEGLTGGVSQQARIKRRIKEKVYLRIPSGYRSILFFLYRYVFRLGFLDGVEGYYFHVLQCFWYRTLVDAKTIQIEKARSNLGLTVPQAIKYCTGISVNESMTDKLL